MGHAFGVGVIEDDVLVRRERRAVIEQQGGTGGEAGHQPVPHHPAAGGEVIDAVARLHVTMQAVLLEVLQQGPAGTMDDALGHAGGARGVHDVERMIKGQLGKFKIVDVSKGLDEIAQHACVRHRRQLMGLMHIGDDDHALERGQLRDNFPQALQNIDCLAGVVIAVAGHQHLGLGLAEAIEYALNAKIRRSGSEDGANARRRQHRHQGLGHVGHVGRDPVPRHHPLLAQRGREARHRTIELAMAHAVLDAVLAPEHERIVRVS